MRYFWIQSLILDVLPKKFNQYFNIHIWSTSKWCDTSQSVCFGTPGMYLPLQYMWGISFDGNGHFHGAVAVVAAAVEVVDWGHSMSHNRVSHNSWVCCTPVYSDLREITDLETIQLVSRLVNSTSYRHNNLDLLAIKATASLLIIPVRLEQLVFAKRWNILKVVPLHKSKELNHIKLSSFRPVSNLPTISKLVE